MLDANSGHRPSCGADADGVAGNRSDHRLGGMAEIAHELRDRTLADVVLR